MTTTIAPSLGHGALATQQGIGTTPGYDAIDVRRMANGDLQEGVLNASDFMVVQRAAGANMSVDIGMPAGGFAYVQGDTVSGQGLYTVPSHSATVNEAITAANATNPRIDQIILEVLDNVHDASGSNLARTRVLTGTATAGATLANRTGALALPGNALLLADVLVGASVSSIANNVIRDRRKWARGACWVGRRASGAGTINITSTTYVAVDTTNYQARVECSGVPLRVTWQPRTLGAFATLNSFYGLFQDGVIVEEREHDYTAGGNQLAAAISWIFSPAGGSHLFTLEAKVSASTLAIVDQSEMVIEEIARQNTANNTVTSG